MLKWMCHVSHVLLVNNVCILPFDDLVSLIRKNLDKKENMIEFGIFSSKNKYILNTNTYWK